MQRRDLDVGKQRAIETKEAVENIIRQSNMHNQAIENPNAAGRRFEFLIFPLFLAGIEVHHLYSDPEKHYINIDKVLEFLEFSSLGNHVGMVRGLLQKAKASIQKGNHDFDWIEFMKNAKLKLIFFDF